jgi:hypothetical protein
MSKQPLDWQWHSNGRRIYYDLATEVKGADARTFTPLNHVWATDGTHVFQRDKVLRGADPNTFVVLNDLYAKDERTVFYPFGKISNADAPTFVAFDTDDDSGYAKDKLHVYHYVFTIGKPVQVRSADALSFQSVGNGYGMDSCSVYHERARIQKADPTQWRMLPGGQYSRDNECVYFGSQLIAGADVETFHALPGFGCARDKSQYFDYGQVVEAENYFRTLRDCFVFIGRVSNAHVTDKRGNTIADLSFCDARREQAFELTIECTEVLWAPDTSVDNPPVVGRPMKMKQRYYSCDLSPWANTEWIWFFHPFHPLQKPNQHRLCPLHLWRHFSPMADLEMIKSLLAEPGMQTTK